jgi:hypothetical protein
VPADYPVEGDDRMRRGKSRFYIAVTDNAGQIITCANSSTVLQAIVSFEEHCLVDLISTLRA